MTRPLRVEYPGAVYHVMSRGNAYKNIFIDDHDRVVFLSNIKKSAEVHNFICYAYCLMGNHYHLLIETPEGNLAKIMRDINGTYSQMFNKKHKSIGHVFQGRYKAFLIEKDQYLLELIRYIANNPVVAKLVKKPGLWKWSSYNCVLGKTKVPSWLDIDFTLGLFSKNKYEAIKQYCKFVDNYKENNSPYKHLKEGIVLGNKQFVDWVWENFNDSEDKKEIAVSNRMISRPSLKTMFTEVKDYNERNNTIKIAHLRCNYTITEIAKHLGLHRSTVSKIFNKNT